MDHGLSEKTAEKLLEAGIPTVERLASMTPEELEAAGISEESIGGIHVAVNSYYGAYETLETEAAVDAGDEVAAAVAGPQEGAPVQEETLQASDVEPEAELSQAKQEFPSSGEAASAAESESDTIGRAD
jgi:hypothetical protein